MSIDENLVAEVLKDSKENSVSGALKHRPRMEHANPRLEPSFE
jgi:hypothetical protein